MIQNWLGVFTVSALLLVGCSSLPQIRSYRILNETKPSFDCRIVGDPLRETVLNIRDTIAFIELNLVKLGLGNDIIHDTLNAVQYSNCIENGPAPDDGRYHDPDTFDRGVICTKATKYVAYYKSKSSYLFKGNDSTFVYHFFRPVAKDCFLITAKLAKQQGP
jgi:hypothetical protein